MFRDFRRILKPQNLLYSQERGLPTTKDDLLNLFKDINLWHEEVYEFFVSNIFQAIDLFLDQHGKNASSEPLSKEVIIELIFLYIKSLPSYLEYETELKKDDLSEIKHAKYLKDNSSHIAASNHYLQELYCYLVHGPDIDNESIATSIPKFSPQIARNTIADWLLPLELKVRDQEKAGDEKALFAEKIQRASKRWNVHQAPNKRRGVYLGEIEIINGERTWKVLYDEETIKKYTPNYNSKKQ